MNSQYTLQSGDQDNQQNIPSHLLWPGAKTKPAVFTFPLNGLTNAGIALLERAKKHPVLFGISSVLIVGGFLFLTVPIAVGFAPMGPVSGSLAALWQSWIGSVVEGSLFACLQSLTMTGVFDNIGMAMVAAGVAGGTVPVPISGGSRGYGGEMVVPAAVFAAYLGMRGF